MKKYFLLVISILFIFLGCNESKSDKTNVNVDSLFISDGFWEIQKGSDKLYGFIKI
ncbi:MAG: hypothetical protein HRT40_13915, partial [Campylobacteraceae bacterium]|nr:hypothetical protein [Campylobacteraceae bacterium]